MLKKWEELQQDLKIEEVKIYYEALKSRKKQLILKRCFDILASSILLVLLSPVMLILAVLIKIDSRGSVIFKQARVTQYGKVFKIFKFRTMVEDAEQSGNTITTKNDYRVTRLGRKIREIRLDEIPQLLNILKGEMSFVGARPEVPKYVTQYKGEMKATLLLPAGLTSVASIQYKEEAQILEEGTDIEKLYIEQVLPQKMVHNLEYIKSFTIWADIKILLQTVCIIFGKNKIKSVKNQHQDEYA